MNLVYKKIEEKDKNQLFKLIETVLGGLENKEYFIPYEQWEYDSMFDEKNYAPLYGAYDGDKLAGMAQLYVSQEMLADFKKEFGLEEYQVCELGGNLVLPEYRRNGITTKLQTIELNLKNTHNSFIKNLKEISKICYTNITSRKIDFIRQNRLLKMKKIDLNSSITTKKIEEQNVKIIF